MNNLPAELLSMVRKNMDLTDMDNMDLAFGFDTRAAECVNPETISGLCYVGCLRQEVKKFIIMKHGYLIDETLFLRLLKDYGDPEMVSRAYTLDTTWGNCHIMIEGKNMDHNKYWEQFGKKTMTLVHHQTNVQIPFSMEFISRINPDEWFIPEIHHRRVGSTGNFTIADLVMSQNTVVGYHCPAPEIYISTGKPIPTPEVEILGKDILIRCEGITATFSYGSSGLSKVRHDYVASKLQEDTDSPLSVLGVTGMEADLTPDFIDIVNRRTLELGTSQAETSNSLINDYEGKKLKYDYVLKPIGCNTYYLIVGVTCVVTNLILQQSTVDDLCSRMRIGLELERMITEAVGENIFFRASREEMNQARSLFAMINKEECESTEHFNIPEIMSICEPPSDSDFEYTSKIIKKCLNEARPRLPEKRFVLDKFLSKFEPGLCNFKNKRITNVPMILNPLSSRDDLPPMDPFNSDLPHHMKKLWDSAAGVVTTKVSYEKALSEAFSNQEPEIKHSWKKESTFKMDFSRLEKIEMAKSGVGAKFLRDDPEIIQKEKLSKLSFHPDVYTDDIEAFIKKDTLKPGLMRMKPHVRELIRSSKRVSTQFTDQKSLEIFDSLLKRELISFYDQVTEIFTELAYNYKHWTIKDQFMHKTTDSGIQLIIRNTGSHIFVSYAFPKDVSKIIDTYRLGPTIFTSNNYYFTDWVSYNEPTLEHFVKAGPYMTSMLIHLVSNYKCEPSEMTEQICQNFNFISLLYLNNKTDSEEMMTSQRYLFMKIFEDATQDPYLFVDRLPEVLRSRLSSFIMKRLINLMDYYSDNRILKIPKKQGETILYEYLNLKSIVTNQEIDLSQKINEFYFGYVVSKERGRGSDRNFKIVKKILQEEYKFRDTIKNVFTSMPDNIVTYSTDPQMLKVIQHLFKGLMKEKVGDNYEEVLLDNYLANLTFTNFSQLATLKASARDHSQIISVPENLDQPRDKIMKSLGERNKEEMNKRPKVLEAIMNLVQDYKNDTGKSVHHMIVLIPWCLDKLNKKNYFDSDIFPKPQHGGDREIHVLEIAARIVQYALELISRVTCRFFPSETITHPETKDHFVRNHYNMTSSAYKSSFVISKSADASKWCQRHHVSHFATMLISITPKILHTFILKTLKLWVHKKISFPLQLCATLLKNQNTFSTNETFVRFRDEFFNGSGVFTQKMGNKIEIQSGMMQGILHYTSSLYHTMIQEVCRVLVVEIARKRYQLNVICSIVQGSDDSGMMLGIEGSISKKKIQDAYTLLRFKEEISNYVSVYWNVCKSSIGTIDLIEYNSEWHFRHQVIKPTFRWISACMEISVTERFIDRVRIFYQILSQCLEGGASTLECSVVQLCQCWMHYLLLGISNSVLGKDAAKLLIRTNNVQCGFFPLDFDLCCGIPGVDFLIYVLASKGTYEIPNITDDDTLQYEYEGQDKSIVPKDLRSIKLKFGKLYLWKSLLNRIELGTLEDAIEKIQKDPMILFGRHTSWDEEVPNLLIKVFSPGVKESINNVSSCLRLMAASAYILNRPCLSVYESDVLKKRSLLSLLQEKANTKHMYNSIEKIKTYFPLYHEYEPFLKMITKLSQTSETFTQQFSRSSKTKIIVFELMKTEVDLIDLCKRKWNLGGRVSLSSRQFDSAWSMAKIKYPFLTDNLKSTSENLKMTYVELKNFLESLINKSRKVTLYDSPVRHGGIDAAITRIYWPNVKVRSSEDSFNSEYTSLRSHLFSILTYWYTDIIAEKKIKAMIHNSKCLRPKYTNIPNKMKKLKTIFDWSHGVDKMELVNQIQNQRQGVMGFFSRVQGGYGKKLIGPGEWRGQIIGVPVVVSLMNNTTTMITIRHLKDTNVLGNLLSELLTEFKCNEPGKIHSSDLWLSNNGKITSKTHEKGIYIPINIDENLRVDIMKDVEANPWVMKVKNTTVRLMMRIDSGGASYEYTILSESLSQRDWIPELKMHDGDYSLTCWNNNKPYGFSDLDSELDSVIPSNMSQFLKFFSKIKTVSTSSGWDLTKFRNQMITMLVSREESNKAIQPEIISEMPAGIDTMLEIQKLMQNVPMTIDEFFSSNQGLAIQWGDADADDEEEIQNPFQMDSDFNDSMKNQLSELSKNLEITYDHPDREADNDKDWRRMSQSNKYFANVDISSHIGSGVRFYELYKEAKGNENIMVPGFLGKLLSLCLGRLVYQGRDTKESLVDIQSESSRQVGTIMSGADLENLSQASIEQAISQLESIIPNLTGHFEKEMQRSLNRYKRLLLLKMSPTRTSDLEDINYAEFMSMVVESLFSNYKTKIRISRADSNLKLSIIKSEIIEYQEQRLILEEISNHEFTLIREHINRNIVSSYLIDSLCECYSISIDLGMYKHTNQESDIEIVYN